MSKNFVYFFSLNIIRRAANQGLQWAVVSASAFGPERVNCKRPRASPHARLSAPRSHLVYLSSPARLGKQPTREQLEPSATTRGEIRAVEHLKLNNPTFGDLNHSATVLSRPANPNLAAGRRCLTHKCASRLPGSALIPLNPHR